MELMVAMLVIAILAALAMPSMAVARADRHAYDDAASVAALVRSARLLAIAHGAAIIVTMTSPPGDLGTYRTYEAVPVTQTGAPRPVSSCFNGGAAWPLSPQDASLVTFVEGLNMNGTIESRLSISSAFTDPGGTVPTTVALCITPLGRTYYVAGAANPTFAAANILTGALKVSVKRTGGLTRNIWIPPTGVARVESQ